MFAFNFSDDKPEQIIAVAALAYNVRNATSSDYKFA